MKKNIDEFNRIFGVFDDYMQEEMALEIFSGEMAERLRDQRDNGKDGWKIVPIEFLQKLLVKNMNEGDMIDVANVAMFLYFRGTEGFKEQD